MKIKSLQKLLHL